MNAKQQLEFESVRVWYPVVHTRQPDGSVVSRPGQAVTLASDLIGTGAAGSILGLSQRQVESMCDDGRFVEGVDWFRPGEKTGRDGKTRGKILLRRESVIRKMGPTEELFK